VGGHFLIVTVVLNKLSQIDDFMAWLNPKGIREAALKTALSKWWSHITLGIRKRIGVGNFFFPLHICTVDKCCLARS
jgi:hypothetical protein